MSGIDYYAILEVSSNATLEQIKRAYRRLVRLHHPDLTRQAQDTRIKQLNEAYAVLRDSTKRATYDLQRLEELRHAAMQEMLHRAQQEVQRQPKMTWPQGLAGFVRELKRGMREG